MALVLGLEGSSATARVSAIVSAYRLSSFQHHLMLMVA